MTAARRIAVTQQYQIEACDGPVMHKTVRVNPNPAATDVGISIMERSVQNNLIVESPLGAMDPQGYAFSIKRTDTGASMLNGTLYANGEQFSVSSFPTGYYQLNLQFNSGTVLSRTFAVFR